MKGDASTMEGQRCAFWTLDCTEAWLLTDPENSAARRMYAAPGGVEAASQILVAVRL